MTHSIGQTFLDQSVHRYIQIRRQYVDITAYVQRTIESVRDPGLPAVDEIVQGFPQTDGFQPMRPQARQHAADQLHDVAAQLFNRVRAIDYLRGAVGRLASDIRRIDFDCGQTLTELVVQLPSQAFALLLFGLNDPPGQITSLYRSFL